MRNTRIPRPGDHSLKGMFTGADSYIKNPMKRKCWCCYYYLSTFLLTVSQWKNNFCFQLQCYDAPPACISSCIIDLLDIAGFVCIVSLMCVCICLIPCCCVCAGLQQGSGLVGPGSAGLWDGCRLPSVLCRPAHPDIRKNCIRKGKGYT